MITFKDLLSGNNVSDIPINHQQNLEGLLKMMRLVELSGGWNFVVTSGYRTLQHHLEIYSRKGLVPPHVPMKSNHLVGHAVDIADPKGQLMAWCLLNTNLLTTCGLYIEEDTRGWVHFQDVPPASGKRFFKP
jgi:hypothetical protein